MKRNCKYCGKNIPKENYKPSLGKIKRKNAAKNFCSPKCEARYLNIYTEKCDYCSKIISKKSKKVFKYHGKIYCNKKHFKASVSDAIK